MSLKSAGSFASLLAALGLMTVPMERLAAQYAPTLARQYASAWENDRIRIRTVSVEPGARLAASPGGADRVLIFLTADLDGRMPAAEAIWQPGGGAELENKGRVRADAIVVDVKPSSAGPGSGTPPEALLAREGVDVRVLIDNPRVAVMRLRYSPHPVSLDVVHSHPQDAVVVYLAGGYTWLPPSGWGYPARVRRGEFDVVPAQTLHSFATAGGDALEFLMIVPK